MGLAVVPLGVLVVVEVWDLTWRMQGGTPRERLRERLMLVGEMLCLSTILLTKIGLRGNGVLCRSSLTPILTSMGSRGC